MLEEAPKSAKQLCTLKLKLPYVSRKGGIWYFECAPILVSFMVYFISILCSDFVSTTLEMLSSTTMVLFCELFGLKVSISRSYF
jgi:hypothetical protein